MSDATKLIIPLLDYNLKLEDINPNTGFIGVYSYDINKPFFENHIFLLYNNNIITKESVECYKKLKSLKTVHSFRNLKINGNSFTVFVFPIMTKTIRDIKNNCSTLTYDEKMRIAAFWNFTDADINNYILDDTNILSFEFKESIIPEEDYTPSCTVVYDKKSGALQYRSVPL